jgi:hypothetical protein
VPPSDECMVRGGTPYHPPTRAARGVATSWNNGEGGAAVQRSQSLAEEERTEDVDGRRRSRSITIEASFRALTHFVKK